MENISYDPNILVLENRFKELDIIQDLLNLYEKGKYLDCIENTESYFNENPKVYIKSTLLRNIYLNSCLKMGIDLMERKEYLNAKIIYDKILIFESELIFESDVVLYKIYSQLAEIMRNIENAESSEDYEEKAKLIINKMVYSRAIQCIYSDFVEGKYDEVVSSSHQLDVNDLDEYNKGRYYMMIGSAYYYMKEYKKGITYLKRAIKYYKNKTYNSILIMIYEELSKCYMHLEEYHHAHKYLKLAHDHTTMIHAIEVVRA